jgi:hypothetical protein
MTLGDAEKIEATALASARQKSLELLFDYTKFHIGLYLTLTTAYIAATALKKGPDTPVLSINAHFFWPAVLCFMVAGLAGGVIASSITQTDSRSAREFLNQSVGPWDWHRLHFRARVWTWVEHTSFWFGLVLAAISASPR